MIIEGPASGKTNVLLNLINHKPDIDKIHLYTNDPYEAKYQLLINKREITALFKLSKKLLLNTQMIGMIFTKILKNTIQIKNEKYYLYLMIWLLICLVIKNLIQ